MRIKESQILRRITQEIAEVMEGCVIRLNGCNHSPQPTVTIDKPKCRSRTQLTVPPNVVKVAWASYSRMAQEVLPLRVEAT